MNPSKQTHWAVRNLNGTSRNKCNCKNWIAHWKLGSGRRGYVSCAVHGCSRPAEVGAHVQITDGRSSWHWWIVPFCRGHNHTSNVEEMYLKTDVDLISANVMTTCQRGDWWEDL